MTFSRPSKFTGSSPLTPSLNTHTAIYSTQHHQLPLTLPSRLHFQTTISINKPRFYIKSIMKNVLVALSLVENSIFLPPPQFFKRKKRIRLPLKQRNVHNFHDNVYASEEVAETS